MTLSRADARTLIEAAVAHAASIDQRVAIAVVDAHGRTVSADRMDDTKMNREQMAIGKAWAAVMLEEPTSEANASAASEAKFHSLLAMFPGKVYVSAGGGVPIITDGTTIGAIGVAGGDQSGVDDAICDAAIGAWRA